MQVSQAVMLGREPDAWFTSVIHGFPGLEPGGVDVLVAGEAIPAGIGVLLLDEEQMLHRDVGIGDQVGTEKGAAGRGVVQDPEGGW